MGTAYLAMAILIVSTLVHGKVTDFFGEAGDTVRFVLIFVAVSLNLIAAMICAWRKMVLPAALSVLSIVGIFVFTYNFSRNSGVPFTLAAGGEYFGYSFLAIFVLTLRDRNFGRVMQMFYLLCCGYAIFYLIASLAVQAGLVDLGEASRAFVGADDAGRGDRLYSSSLALVFGTMGTLVRVLRKFSPVHVVILGIFALDWYLTSSRTISAIVLLIMVAFVVVKNTRLIGRIAFASFLAGTAFSVFLIFRPEYNPFYIAIDTSGLTRVLSVNIAADLMQYYWVMGAGIGYGIEAYLPITGSRYFYPSDIGMIGILFSYGIAGFVLYIVLTYLSCNIFRPVVQRGYPLVTAEALMLSASVFALYSLQAPHFDSNAPASVLAMIAAAFALTANRAKRPGGPRPHHQYPHLPVGPNLRSAAFSPGNMRR
jgi:hypothetical protein